MYVFHNLASTLLFFRTTTMPTAARWMLYGATGTTGRLILDEALRRGHRPLVAGRDAPRVSDLAGRHGLEAVPFPLDADECHDALANVAVVVNAAGPYFETGVPLREACLRAGASYIDVNGEVDDFLAALACDARARAKGIAVVPGAGFGVVFGEALAAHVASRLPDATWMRMSLAPATETTSTAAMRSTAAVLAKGGHAVAGGVLEKRPMAFHTWRVSSPEPGGSAIGFAAAPRAELVAA